MNESLIYKLIGSKVRLAREHHEPRMSQTLLAKKVNMQRASIVNIEAGRQRPPVHVLWSIAEAIGVDLSSLIPEMHELRDAEQPVHLDEEAIARIEAAANGDAATRMLLTQFVSRAKSVSQKG